MTANAGFVYQRPKPKPRSLWRRVGDGIVRMIEVLAEARRRRRAIRAMQRLDDRMLADIGVSRSGIEAAVRDGDRKAPLRARLSHGRQPMRLAA